MRAMRNSIFGIIILIAVFSFWGMSVGGKTAKASFSQAQASAKSWQADVVLTQISAGDVSGDGTSGEWTYSFYSPKSKKWFTVTAEEEDIDGVEVGFGRTGGVDVQFIDSDKAMEEAKKHGLKGSTPGMSLSVYEFGEKVGSFWMVTGGYEKGNTSIILDAKTGELFTRKVID